MPVSASCRAWSCRRGGIRSTWRAHEASGATIGAVPCNIEIPDYAKSPLRVEWSRSHSSNADAFVTSNPDPLLKDALPPRRSRPAALRRRALTTYWVMRRLGRCARRILMTSVQDARDGRTVFQAQDRRGIDASERPLTHGFSTEVP